MLMIIDFIETLFRLLAGLYTPNGSISIGGSTSKIQSSDLLFQVIFTKEVSDVFISMCIVGLFLLLITTVFKIIQVEYTTEGSKNAKGPILTKAFKGLCNMVLVPVLVIFGIFIGNEVLDLLDKATSTYATTTDSGVSSSSKTSIAGVLFATSVSDSFYTDAALKMEMATFDLYM